MPLDRGPVFIENRGQFDSRVKFRLAGHGPTLWLTNQGIVFDAVRAKAQAQDPSTSNRTAMNQLQLRLPLDRRSGQVVPDEKSLERLAFSEEFIGASSAPAITASGRQPGIYNFFIGNDPKKWVTEVAAYSEVLYRDLWPGIDLRLYRNGQDIEKEFVIRPGADLTEVQMSYRGIDGLKIANDGALVIKTAFGELRETKPRMYQEIAGQRVPVEGCFKLASGFAYTFDVKSHESQYALVIDPTLIYSGYLGLSPATEPGLEWIGGIAVDPSGNAYVVGATSSSDFPTTVGAFQTSMTASESAFVSKLNPSGSALVYSTFLGGGSDSAAASAHAVALDSWGNAYVTGQVSSPNFPTTPGAFQTSMTGSQNAFVTELNPSGSALLYSTYLGGSDDDRGWGIAVDSSGNAYVAGYAASSDFPTTPGAFQTSLAGDESNAFVSELNPSGSALVYSTYLGSSGKTRAYGIAVDSSGNAYVTGGGVIPTTPGAFQKSLASHAGENAFVSKLNPSGSALLYSTYLGGTGGTGTDYGMGIAVDSSGNAYVAGVTDSSDFPTTAGAFQPSLTGSVNAFVSELNSSGSALAYSTGLGSGMEYGFGIALDSVGDIYVTGCTKSCQFPVTPNAIQPTCGGKWDAFLSALYPAGEGAADLLYSSYLGGSDSDVGLGIAVDPSGNAYLTGFTQSSDFPVTPGAFQSFSSGTESFVAKFALGIQGLSVQWTSPNAGGNTGTVTMTIVGTGFQPGATVQLNCPGLPSIVGTNTIVSSNGRLITAIFNLVGATPAACNVVVTDPNGATASPQQAFTIEQGGAPSVWVDIVGFSRLRAGKPQQYFLVYGNSGDLDAYLTPVWFEYPSFMTSSVPNLGVPPSTGSGVSIDWSQVPPQVPAGDGVNTLLPLLVPIIPAGASGEITIELTAPDTLQYAHAPFTLQAWASEPWYTTPIDPSTDPPQSSISPLQSSISPLQSSESGLGSTGCEEAVEDTIIHFLGIPPIPAGCISSVLSSTTNQEAALLAACQQYGIVANPSLQRCLEENSDDTGIVGLLWSSLQTGLECASEAISDATGYAEVVSAIRAIQSGGEASSACQKTIEPQPSPEDPQAQLPSSVIVSGDPNDKGGSPGVGVQQYISGTRPLRYAIQFGNEPTATAPAQKVVVTDPLDTTNDNLQTLTLGPISVLSQLVTPPPGLAQVRHEEGQEPVKCFRISSGYGRVYTTFEVQIEAIG